MQIIKSVSKMRFAADQMRINGGSVGFVPTMGALHEGHVSLIKRAVKDNECVVLSIFVNPIQFDRDNDLSRYPVQREKDREIAGELGVDIVFEPEVEEMYPDGFATFVDFNKLTNVLCGAERPGHFRGVATVVTKLFNIVRPHRAYFGQKDFQQSVVIKRLVMDLDLDVEIVVLPICREADGLACSSRNVHLNRQERLDALSLFKAIKEAGSMVDSGIRDSGEIIRSVGALIKSGESVKKIEYISIVDVDTLENLDFVNGKSVLVMAVRVGDTRLIDNCILICEV